MNEFQNRSYQPHPQRIGGNVVNLKDIEEAKAEFPNGRRFETPMDHANAIIDWFNHWFGEKECT